MNQYFGVMDKVPRLMTRNKIDKGSKVQNADGSILSRRTKIDD